MKANLPPPGPPPQPDVPPASAPAQAVPPRRRKRLLVASAVGVVLLASAGVYAWVARREPPPPDPPMPAGITDPEVAAAVEKARARVVGDPRSAEAWGEYGSVLLGNLFDREADFCLAEAARLDPKEPRWPYGRGLIAMKRDPGNAVALLTSAAEAARDQPRYRAPFTLALAEALVERGQTDRAAELFQEVMTRDPQDERALYGMGLVALARGDDTTAARLFEGARRNPSCRKQANAQLSALARARGDVEAAKRYEGEANAVESEPPWPDPYLDRVVDLQVGYRGLDRRVGILERDGRFDEAAAAYLEQAKSHRTAKVLTGAAVNLARPPRRDYDQAITLLREAVQLDPADPRARYTLALVLFNKAEKQYVADPASPSAARLFREVIEEARQTTDLKPDHAQAYTIRGVAHKYLGEPAAAVDPLRKALSVRPEDFIAHLTLGQVLAATGDRAGAEASLKAARDLRPDDPRPAEELSRLKGAKGG